MFRLSMNRSSCFYRLITMNAFHGGTAKHYLTLPDSLLKLCGPPDDAIPFNIIRTTLVQGVGDGHWTNDPKSAPCEKLEPGMVLIKNFISFMGQVDIVNICQNLGVGPGGFYLPTNRRGGQLREHVMSFGRNWDPVSGYKNSCRGDGSEPPKLPLGLVYVAKTAIKAVQPLLDLDELPSMCPDTCLVNFLSAHRAPIRLHRDLYESSNSLKSGLPVVSISIGDTAEFWYGYSRDKNNLRRILLESGDVLIYGGKSRRILHRVKRVLRNTTSQQFSNATRLRAGWLNLTLRQF